MPLISSWIKVIFIILAVTLYSEKVVANLLLLIMVNADFFLEQHIPTTSTVIPFCSGFYRQLELQSQGLPFLEDQVNPAEYKVMHTGIVATF
ncbi:uncharacterized protein AAG666_009900 isoform 1-T1 [Megaptera novaeangliae]